MGELVDALVIALRFIESSECEEVRYLHEIEEVRMAKAVEMAEGCACEALVDNEGGCNWEAHVELAMVEDRWRPFAGERDSFGWLTGCIRTSKGILVYG